MYFLLAAAEVADALETCSKVESIPLTVHFVHQLNFSVLSWHVDIPPIKSRLGIT